MLERRQRDSGRTACRPRRASYEGVPLSEHSVITRVITVAKGVFAPGHLGELTRIVPFEMV
ncbi:hypothetical protein KBX37_33640, partial [Micromonospora sp. U56]|uniref:hypothetical protein n=1 Tax=Micromonospora sp. U56 TaxID=2824900 RepID=UPI001B35EC20